MNYSKYTEKLKALHKDIKISFISFKHKTTEKQENPLHKPNTLIIDSIPTFGGKNDFH